MVERIEVFFGELDRANARSGLVDGDLYCKVTIINEEDYLVFHWHFLYCLGAYGNESSLAGV